MGHLLTAFDNSAHFKIDAAQGLGVLAITATSPGLWHLSAHRTCEIECTIDDRLIGDDLSCRFDLHASTI